MKINPDKFDVYLESNLEPFVYVEDNRTIKTKNAGKIMVISFGALNYQGHYAPEFGGVAIVHVDPDVLIAIKYIPWNAKARRQELMEQYMHLKANHNNMSPSDITHYFYLKCGYVLPAKKQRLKEEYYIKVAQENRARAAAMQAEHEKQLKIQEASSRGRIATLNRSKASLESMKTKNEEETTEKKQADNPPPKPADEPEIYEGEKLIPLDDDEEE